MHRSYYDVNRNPINNSSSKQIFSFGRSSRFARQTPSNCIQHSYDVNKSIQTLAKSTKVSFPQSQRFSKSGVSNVNGISNCDDFPSPGAYKINSFAQQNKRNHKGAPFTKSHKGLKYTSIVPGPGSYKPEVFNPQKSFSYTMRIKTKQIEDKSWNKVGPGDYFNSQFHKMGRSDIHNKFKNSQSSKIAQSARFIFNDEQIPGPGKYDFQKVYKIGRLQTEPISTIKNDGKYSFGHEQKHKQTTIQAMKKYQPGPGAYTYFSQFADLHKKSFYKSKRY